MWKVIVLKVLHHYSKLVRNYITDQYTSVNHHIGNQQNTGAMHDLLFEGGSINTTTSWYAVMHYALSHHLSYAAIEDLIALIKVK